MCIEIFDEQMTAYARDHADITIHSHAPFYPAPPSIRFKAARRELAGKLNSYAIHHYANTWVGWHIRLTHARSGCGASLTPPKTVPVYLIGDKQLSSSCKQLRTAKPLVDEGISVFMR